MKPRTGILGPLAVAMAIAMGVLAVWFVFGVWAVNTVSRRFTKPSPYQQLAVRVDGTPLIAHYPGDYRDEVTYRNLDGRPEPIEPGTLSEISGASLAKPGGTPPRYLRPWWEAWSSRINSYNDYGKPQVFWYFIHTGASRGSGILRGVRQQVQKARGLPWPRWVSQR